MIFDNFKFSPLTKEDLELTANGTAIIIALPNGKHSAYIPMKDGSWLKMPTDSEAMLYCSLPDITVIDLQDTMIHETKIGPTLVPFTFNDDL